MSVELATAYISLVPPTKGIAAQVRNKIGPPSEQAAKQAGISGEKSFGENLLRNASAGLDRLGQSIVDSVTKWGKRAILWRRQPQLRYPVCLLARREDRRCLTLNHRHGSRPCLLELLPEHSRAHSSSGLALIVQYAWMENSVPPAIFFYHLSIGCTTSVVEFLHAMLQDERMVLARARLR